MTQVDAPQVDASRASAPDSAIPTRPVPAFAMTNSQTLNLIAPIRFDGGETTDDDDFLDTLEELSFPLLDQQVAEAKRERAKVLALQSLLDGKACEFWSTLRRDRNTTFGRAAMTLRQRFPARSDDDAGQWAVRLQAVADMGELRQEDLTSRKYTEKAEGLFAASGDDYSLILASKFLQGLRDPILKYAS